MIELWKDIPGQPGYQASNLGNIRGVPRTAKVKGGVRSVKGMTLKAFPSGTTGYLQVALFKARLSVHRLVALAWCDGYFDGAVVDHLNDNRQDNRAENLEWVTYSENTRRSFERGRVPPSLGQFSADHPTSKAVIATNLATGEETTFDAAMDAVRAGFDSSSISRCCHGQSKSHKGHAWRFALTETRNGGWLDAYSPREEKAA